MMKIAAKLLVIMEKCDYIQKEARNNEQKYNYVPDAAVMRKINPQLVANKLIAVPEFSIISEKEKPTAKGAIWQLVSVQCKLRIIDAESGEELTTVALGSGTDPGDKAIAKAQTAALKYAWLKTLQIETGDDPEADEQTDQQTFTSVPPIQNDWQTLNNLWIEIGWDIQQLPGYLEQRFKKPVNQLTSTEYQVLIQEAQGHLAFKRQENEVPF